MNEAAAKNRHANQKGITMKHIALALVLAVSVPALAVVATKSAAAKKKPAAPSNNLPEDGRFEHLDWGLNTKAVARIFAQNNRKVQMLPAPAGYVQVAEMNRVAYGVDSEAVMYTFREDKLVAVTIAAKPSTPVVLLRLISSLRTTYADGKVLSQGETPHSITMAYTTPTGMVVIAASATAASVAFQLVFISADEVTRLRSQQKTEPTPDP